MRGKALAARQQRLRDLAIRDALRRCRSCRRALGANRVVVVGIDGAFCSNDCVEDYPVVGPQTPRRNGR